MYQVPIEPQLQAQSGSDFRGLLSLALVFDFFGSSRIFEKSAFQSLSRVIIPGRASLGTSVEQSSVYWCGYSHRITLIYVSILFYATIYINRRSK